MKVYLHNNSSTSKIGSCDMQVANTNKTFAENPISSNFVVICPDCASRNTAFSLIVLEAEGSLFPARLHLHAPDNVPYEHYQPRRLRNGSSQGRLQTYSCQAD